MCADLFAFMAVARRSEDASGYVLWGVGLVVAGIFVYLLAFRFNRTRLRVRNTAISKADSVAIGTAALQGVVQADNLSVAPISGKPSAYWQLEVSEFKSVKREDSKVDEWVVVRQDQFRPPDFHFDVADASGSRKVIGEAATMMLRWDEYNSTKPQPQLPPAGHDYLNHHNFEWKFGKRQYGSLKVRETRLEQGGQVYVLGTASEVSDVKNSKTRPSGRLQNVFSTIGGIDRIVQAARSRQQAEPSDAAGLGNSLQAAQLSQKLRETGNPALVELGNRIDAGGASPAPVSELLELLEAARADGGYIATLPEVEVVIWRGDRTYPFIISNMTQPDVARSLRKRAWLDIVFGPALIIGGLLLILLNASAAIAQYHRVALSDAAGKNDVAGIHAAMRAGADINERNEDGQTLLIQKIRGNNLAGARALIAGGADPNVKDNYGDTALIVAVQQRNDALVGELIAAHAGVNAMDKAHMTALLEAARQNDGVLVRQLLDAGADPNMRDSDGRTALINAAREGHAEIARLLIDAHADLNLTDNTGTTALQQAQEWEYPEVVRLLQAAGATH